MRISDIEEASLDAEQHRIYNAIKAGPRGIVQGPLRVWLHSPGLAQRAQELGAFCRYGTSLPPVLSELAILVTGAYWRAGFEWHVHAPLAVRAGLADASVEAIRRGHNPQFSDPAQSAVYGFCHQLLTTRRIDEATYQGAVAAVGEVGVVDLVGILGYYALISMTIVSFEVPPPAGSAEPFQEA